MKEAVVLHSAVYTVTLEAGRRLCETMTESESQSQLQSECRAIEEAWEHNMSLLERKTDLANTTVRVTAIFNYFTFTYCNFYADILDCLTFYNIGLTKSKRRLCVV